MKKGKVHPPGRIRIRRRRSKHKLVSKAKVVLLYSGLLIIYISIVMLG